MLLLGLVLLSTVLIAAQNYGDRWVKLCIHEHIVESLEVLEDAEIEVYLQSCRRCSEGVEPKVDPSNDCSAVYTKVHLDGNVSLNLNLKNITGFEKGWCRLRNFTINMISLTGNEIVEVTSEMFNDLPLSVREFGLFSNKIEHLRSGVISNRNLSWLIFSANVIHSIESGALSEMQSLNHLYLDNNQLENMEFAASLPSNLKTLNLCENLISEIPTGIFSKLGKLEYLDLSHNRITVIQQQAFQSLTNLQLLYLSFNPLEIVNKHSFEFTPLLKKVLNHNWQYENLADMNDDLPLYKNRRFIIMKDDN